MSAPVSLPPLDNTVGALFVGVILSAALWGVSCAQTWYYYNTFANDPAHIRLLVGFAWSFDTVHQILITHTLYTYTVTNFGNPVFLGELVWSLLLEIVFNALVALLVQRFGFSYSSPKFFVSLEELSFFMYRVWTLSKKSILLTASIGVMVISELGLSITYATRSLRMKTYADLVQLKNVSMAINIFSAAPDIIIAAALCTLLHRSRTGFRSTNNMVNRLMVFAVNTGLLTSLCAICSLSFFLAYPNTFIYIAFYFMLGRLYMNSLLATLNARKGLKNHTHAGDTSGDVSLSMRRNINQSMQPTSEIAIKIDTVKEYTRDNDDVGDASFDRKMSSLTQSQNQAGSDFPYHQKGGAPTVL
ncbi:hypothetical protein JAAARDRAFT_207418 [Jaapia argillacea MUCL 33604]|uniref:DUF6534 domain-containing protein n=1 Tax=Jaapia argillacea MUCL 33604 TaxID=933084 RepID=A0A067PQH8_9AGAM|nr:hypothetical protein JAAARDRAFT_207418 [Jaapia argillacea MUCL 33604]